MAGNLEQVSAHYALRYAFIERSIVVNSWAIVTTETNFTLCLFSFLFLLLRRGSFLLAGRLARDMSVQHTKQNKTDSSCLPRRPPSWYSRHRKTFEVRYETVPNRQVDHDTRKKNLRPRRLMRQYTGKNYKFEASICDYGFERSS